MNDITLTKTFTEQHFDYGSERFATYQWGDLAISEYDTVSWWGFDYHVETADNPFSGGVSSELPNTVMTLDRMELWDKRSLDPREDIAWWATQQPGLIIGLEVTADGELYAEVWTGSLELWGGTPARLGTVTPQTALERYRDIGLGFNGVFHVTPVTTMSGPVGMVTELQTYPDLGSSDPGFDDDFWSGALR